MIVVSDTSPLTALLTVDEADILLKLFAEVVGVVLLAKRRQLVPSARALLQRLDREAGMYLSEHIREAALRSVGE